MIAKNLQRLRKISGQTQEETAERLGVTRQAVAKWENGESLPDLKCFLKIAQLYHVTLDDLVNYDEDKMCLSIPPKGKHSFGTVTVGSGGEIRIPEKAMEIFHIQPGDKILILGDEASGLAMVHQKYAAELFGNAYVGDKL